MECVKHAQGAAELLSLYSAGSHIFSSANATILASGCKHRLDADTNDGISAAARKLLNIPGDILIGAVPFHDSGATHLVVPDTALIARNDDRATFISACSAMPIQVAASTPMPSPTPDGYRAAVEAALDRIERNELDKVVLSRSLTVAARIDLRALLQRLIQRNPLGYTFAIDLPALDQGQQRTLIGASPELLLAKNGSTVLSHPLAGSIPHVQDPVEDARRAEALLQSAKDLYEHKLVVDAVADALAPFCRQLQVPSRPALVSTSTMWHLGTAIRGELRDADASSLDIALALHPTPAVCGHPTLAARDFISEVEGFDRGYFAGLTGWMNAQGDGEWAVTIRCAEVSEESATLYAGAGIVAGSNPELELAETSGKLRTMLAAMELDTVLEGWS